MDRFSITADHIQKVREAHGFVSFDALYANMNVVGVYMKGKFAGEVVLVQYDGSAKVGYMYFGTRMPPEMVFKVFADVPDDWNRLSEYEKEFGEKTSLAASVPGNYIFLNSSEIQEVNFKTKKKQP